MGRDSDHLRSTVIEACSAHSGTFQADGRCGDSSEGNHREWGAMPESWRRSRWSNGEKNMSLFVEERITIIFFKINFSLFI